MRLPFRAVFGVLVAFLIVEANAAGNSSPQPVPVDTFPDADTEYTGFSATGLISDVNLRVAKITVHSAKPFYAPWAPSVAICALWPNTAPLIVHVSNGVMITVDGKKAGLAQLAVGQTITMQYSIYVFFKGGDEVFCGARKIEARTTASARSH